MTEIIMIMGFLGSGKTTLLESILKNENMRVGVVVNEFGSVSVDGERLRGQNHIDIMEVNSGSIFCACKSDFFIQAVLSLVDMGIKRIYVEASGLSNPSSIKKIMADLNTLNKTKETVKVKSFICVADAERIATLLKVSVAAIAQVQRANVILLNKIDNVDDKKETCAINAIRTLNGKAEIIETVMCDVDLNAIVDQSDYEDELNCIDPKPILERSFTLLCDASVQKSQFDAFIKAMIPLCLRIKGFMLLDEVQHDVDVVSPYISIKKSLTDKPNELVLIVYEDEKETAKAQIEKTWKDMIGSETPIVLI